VYSQVQPTGIFEVLGAAPDGVSAPGDRFAEPPGNRSLRHRNLCGRRLAPFQQVVRALLHLRFRRAGRALRMFTAAGVNRSGGIDVESAAQQ
jgi:hypothetical protein